MPKKLDYPRSSLKNSLELAKAVQSLGGKCDTKTCADKMGKRIGGSFSNNIGGAVKFGLINFSKGQLELTEIYHTYKNAYSEDEKKQLLQKAFLDIPIFNSVYERFRDESLPKDLLDKILIREYQVEEKVSKRISGYFITAAKEVGLLNNDFTFNRYDNDDNIDNETETVPTTDEETKKNEIISQMEQMNNYQVDISGPNIKQTIIIEEPEHIGLVEATLDLIKMKINKSEND